MKITNLIFVLVIAFTIFVCVSSVAGAVTRVPLSFGLAENLSELNIAKVTGTVPTGEYDVKTIRFEIDAAECSIHPIDGFVYLKVGDLKPYTKPGEPQLPMQTFVIKLPKDAEVIGAELTSGNYREIVGELNIVPMPQPVIWSVQKPGKQIADEKAGKLIADEKVYSLETYFPGKAISYDTGSDGEHKIVLLRVFPVQYVPAEKKAIWITDAEVSVYYREGEREEGETFFPATFAVSQTGILNAENLIITPPELFEHAKKLENFHDGKGISTEVVNTTWIYSNYVNASDPPYEGYKNSSIVGWKNITGYNYSLAKRTIKFLNNRSAHPDLKYVTLFGNGRLVPPSYYIYNKLEIFGELGFYNSWIPTDFLYASPDYDFVSDYMVGRIPVNNSEEAEHVVQKIKDWDANMSYDWFKNVTLIGGAPFKMSYYIGELATVDSVNRGYFNGMNLTKLYLSDGNYTPEKVQSAYKGDYGFIYQFSHGSGNEMAKHDPHEGWVDTINTTILKNLSSNTNVPIVASVACMNGAFDTKLYPNTCYEYAQPISFGEGVLLSNAAGIAYIGGSRVCAGGWNNYLDKGYLHVIKEPYMQGMLTYLFEAYHNGSNTLGNMTKTAMEKYVEENEFSDPINNRTFFEFTLLGDPALGLLPQQPSVSYQQPFSTALNPDYYTDGDEPFYINTGTNITINSTTDSPKVFTKRIDTFEFTTVEKMENATTGDAFEYVFSSTNWTEYAVRTESEDGKEGWLYLRTRTPWNKTGMVFVVDESVEGYKNYYEDALSANGYTYDTWDWQRRLCGSPNNSILAQYDAVVWFTGDIVPLFLTSKDIENIATYLDSGGNLFISGQTIGHFLAESGEEEFYHNYLHADYCNDYPDIYTLEGIAGDAIGDELAINISGGDGADNQFFQEEIAPYDENASMVFNYTGDGCGAIKANTTTYKVVYFAFGFEAINNSADRNTVMGRVIRWLSSWNFDTGTGTYPSIFGTHNGTITPSHDVLADKMYTYPCSGTGGHSEYVRMWGNEIDVNASWNGYTGDWHNITFSKPFILEGNHTYNYSIRTGSYPQIIHKQNHTTLDGSLITCKKYIDTNGKEYDDWIPAVRLFI